VANGITEVRRCAHLVTRAAGGYGAIREVVDAILKAQGRWRQLLREHSS
jgi:3-deoxy-D-manno-octulosonate 8-phosphate phosphatase (KDO 8-P phosphatase)